MIETAKDMSEQFEQTWERYTSSWRAETAEERTALFESSLDIGCHYTDPLIRAKGWDELAAYMRSLQQQVPGVHFVTTYFGAHNRKSIAKWEMRNGENATIGDGVSYGEYSEQGRLTAMTGFFEPPPQ